MRTSDCKTITSNNEYLSNGSRDPSDPFCKAITQTMGTCLVGRGTHLTRFCIRSTTVNPLNYIHNFFLKRPTLSSSFTHLHGNSHHYSRLQPIYTTILEYGDFRLRRVFLSSRVASVRKVTCGNSLNSYSVRKLLNVKYKVKCLADLEQQLTG